MWLYFHRNSSPIHNAVLTRPILIHKYATKGRWQILYIYNNRSKHWIYQTDRSGNKLAFAVTVFFEFSQRTDLFGKWFSEATEGTFAKCYTARCLLCSRASGELVTLKRRDERGNVLYRVHLEFWKGCKTSKLQQIPSLKKSHNHASHNAQSWV